MNFIKRGITSVLRKPGKTIILLLLIFILGNIIAFAISVRQAVSNTERNLRLQIGVAATVEMDYEEWEKRNFAELEETLELETIKKIGALPYVKYFDYSMSAMLYSNTIKPYQDTSQDGMYYSQGLSIKGVHDPEILDLKENKIELVSGRTFTEQEVNNLTYVALVSENFAKANQLNVGSKMSMDNIVFTEDGEQSFYNSSDTNPKYKEEDLFASQTYDFEVIGIFKPVEENTQQQDNGYYSSDQDLHNRIYTSNIVAETAMSFVMEKYNEREKSTDFTTELNGDSYQSVFVLEDPLQIDAFREEASAMLPELYKISDTSESFKTVAAPMESISWIASIILIVSVGAALVIITLLISLFLRDRKHEIGIYLSLGEKKAKVIAQIVLEVAAIAVVAITLSLFSGNLLSRGISRQMLNNEIVAQEQSEKSASAGGGSVVYTFSNLDVMGYGNNLTTEDIAKSYRVSLDATTILLFYAVGLGTVLVSTLAPIIYITRLNPKKIML